MRSYAMTDPSMRKSISAFFLILALSGTVSSLAVFSTGCSSAGITENDPAALYKDAEEDIKSDRYQLALDKLKNIKNKFPYSKYAIDAQLRIADVYFMQELYPEAASNYETFRDLHPKHERVSYAMFRIAKSYYNDMPSNVARDLTSAQKAVDAYNEFLRRFPDAPEARKAARISPKREHCSPTKSSMSGIFT